MLVRWVKRRALSSRQCCNSSHTCRRNASWRRALVLHESGLYPLLFFEHAFLALQKSFFALSQRGPLILQHISQNDANLEFSTTQ